MKKHAKILCAILIVASLCASLLFTAGAEEAAPFTPSMTITNFTANNISSGADYKSDVSGNRVSGISTGNNTQSSFISIAKGDTGEDPWIVAYANKNFNGTPASNNNLYINAGTSNSAPFTVVGSGAKGYYVIDFDVATHGDIIPAIDVSVVMRRASDTSGFPFSDEIFLGDYVTELEAWTHVTLVGDIKNNVVKIYINGQHVADSDKAVRNDSDAGKLANDTKVVAQGFRIELTRNNQPVDLAKGQNVAFDNLSHRLFIDDGAELESALSDGNITDWSAYTNGRGNELLPAVAIIDGVECRNFSRVTSAFNTNDVVDVEFLASPLAPIDLCANAVINTNGMDYNKIFTPISGCKIESVSGNIVTTSAPFVSNYQENEVNFSSYSGTQVNIDPIFKATKGSAQGNLYNRFAVVSASSVKNWGTLGYRSATIITDTSTGTSIYRESANVAPGSTTTKQQNEYSNFNFQKVTLSYEEGKNEYIVMDFDYTYTGILDTIGLLIIPRGNAGYHATSIAVKNLPVAEGEMVHVTAVHDFTDNVAYYFVNGVLTNTVNGGAIHPSHHSKYLNRSETLTTEEYKLGSNSISTLYFSNMNIRYFDVDRSADTVDAAIRNQNIAYWTDNIYTADYRIAQFPAIATVDGVPYHSEADLEAALFGNRKTPAVVKVLHAFEEVITVNCDATVYTYGQSVSFVDANGKSLTPDKKGVISHDIPYMPARSESPLTVVGGANATDVYDAIKYNAMGNLFTAFVHSDGSWGSVGHRYSSLVKNIDTADVLYRNAAILNADGTLDPDSKEYVDMTFDAQSFIYSAGTNNYLVVDFDFATDASLEDDVSVILTTGAEPLVLKNLGIIDGDTAHVTIVYDFTDNYAHAFVNGLFACSVEGGATADGVSDVTVDSLRLSTEGKTSAVCLDNIAIRAFSYATAEDTLADVAELGNISAWEESIYRADYKISKIPTLAIIDGREYGSIDTVNKILAIETSYVKSVAFNYIPESDVMIRTEAVIETNGLNVPLNWHTGLYEFDPGIERYRGTRTGLAYASTKFVYTSVGTAYTFQIINADNCWNTASVAIWAYKITNPGVTVEFQDYDVVFYPYGETMEPIDDIKFVEGTELHTINWMELHITGSTGYSVSQVKDYPVANSNESLRIYYCKERTSSASYAATDILYSANISTDIELVLYVNKSQTITNTGNIVTIDGKEYVAFTYKLAPHEIDKVITVNFEVANGALPMLQKQDMCFVEYARELLENSTVDKSLIVSLLNYANEAHALFDANGEKMPTVTELVSEYAQYLPTEELTEKLDTSALRGVIRSASMRLNSTPEFVFKIARGFRGTVTVSYTGVNGPVTYSVYVNALASEQNITLKGMSISEIANDLTISVLPHGQDAPIECQYNLATYAQGLENNAFAVALYNYAKVAKAYQGGVNYLPAN